MKKIYLLMMAFCLGSSLSIAVGPQKNDNVMKTTFRVIPYDGYFFLCRGTNISENGVVLSQVITPFADSNTLLFLPLELMNTDTRGMGFIGSYDTAPPYLYIEPTGNYTLVVGKPSSYDYVFRQVQGYMKIKWIFGGVHSQNLYVAFPDNKGVIAPPVVDSPVGRKSQKDQIALAFIFHEDQPRELGFLVMNKKEEVFTAMEPLSEQSPILVTSPVIGYQREIFLKDKDTIAREVPSRGVAEWRIAWTTVLELIPEEEKKKIIEAGGDLDLVWRTGGEESPPLLMNIAPPGTFKDSEFVPHPIKENTMIIADPQEE